MHHPRAPRDARFLLIGPYDPSCGEYTFLAPPLGVWRLAGVLADAGIPVEVFDPNCCTGAPERELEAVVAAGDFGVVGVSTTGMTLRYDLALAHRVRRLDPGVFLVAGGMEATFRPESMFDLGPFDMVVLGEGERPLTELSERLRSGAEPDGIAGTVVRRPDGGLARSYQKALGRQELVEATRRTPYESMPYERYWQRLERAYRLRELPYKAQREARLTEIRSVRLNTLNYCPMACTFCSSTNFLHAAQDGVARLARLDAPECLEMIGRIVSAQPGVRTVIFQDDIFVFNNDSRILPLCEGIVAAKRRGALPAGLHFISTNRIDAMSAERLEAMRDAGFRILGFGVESFSRRVLQQFNKSRIYPHIDPVLKLALELGITPFLDLILTSPRCNVEDLGETVRQAHRWSLAGCEIGMYPYVIPFSGAAMANDPSLEPYTVSERHRVDGTEIEWDQPARILPVDDEVRGLMARIESGFSERLHRLTPAAGHLPSRVRSLLWTLAAIGVLEETGQRMPDAHEVELLLSRHLPGTEVEEPVMAG